MTDWRRLPECATRAFGEWRDVKFGAAAERSAIVVTTVLGRREAYSNEPRFVGMRGTKVGGSPWAFEDGCSEEFKAEVAKATSGPARAKGETVG